MRKKPKPFINSHGELLPARSWNNRSKRETLIQTVLQQTLLGRTLLAEHQIKNITEKTEIASKKWKIPV